MLPEANTALVDEDIDCEGSALKRAEEIKVKLRHAVLTANQRKKYRKKLSKLFHVDGDAGEETLASSDFSGMFEEAGSVSTHPAQLTASHGSEHSHGRQAKRARTQQQGKAVKPPCTSNPATATEAAAPACGDAVKATPCTTAAMHTDHQSMHGGISGSVHTAAVPSVPPIRSAGVSSTCLSQLTTAGEPSATAAVRSITAVQQHYVMTASVAQPPVNLHHQHHQQQQGGPLHAPPLACHMVRHPPQQHRRRGPGDLSSVMHIIAAEMRTLEVANVVSQRGTSRPASSAGRSFCRVNLSQELSVISAELSMSIPGHRTADESSGDDGLNRDQPCSSREAAAGAVAGPSHRSARSQEQRQKRQKRQHSEVKASRLETLETAAPLPEAAGSGQEAEQEGAEAAAERNQQGQQQQQQGGKKKKMYIHGNYHNYYGYRALGSFEEDPRLRLFQACWFQGREVLDVGCNEGLVTLAVAARFGCSRTTGVDIDSTLIKRSRSNLKEMRMRLSQQLSNRHRKGGLPSGHAASLAAAIISGSSKQQAPPQPAAAAVAAAAPHAAAAPAAAADAAGSGAADAPSTTLGSPAAAPAAAGAAGRAAQQPAAGGAAVASGRAVDKDVGGTSHSAAEYVDPVPQQAALRHALKALSRTHFKRQDWSKGRTREQSYDTIMCLSVTKWVHLNGGDAALKKLFKKMYDSLTPGGFLILEPQPWRSYRSAVHKRQTCAVPYRHIEQLQLRPEMFLQHLTQVLGFVQLADLNSSSTSHHFDRPLYVLQRPAGLPAQLPDADVGDAAA